MSLEKKERNAKVRALYESAGDSLTLRQIAAAFNLKSHKSVYQIVRRSEKHRRK